MFTDSGMESETEERLEGREGGRRNGKVEGFEFRQVAWGLEG